MTIAQALAVGVMRLRSPLAPPMIRESARFDAQTLLAEVVHTDGAWLLAHGSDELDDDLLRIFGLLLDERMKGVPVAYLTHKAGFYGREFYVDERVLVPRPESEHLIEGALEALRAAGSGPLRALDVGTGSGALAITLAAELPNLSVVATDISEDALAVARRNAHNLGVADRVRFLHADLAGGLEGERFACVVANLPYIPRALVPAAPDPVSFEPLVALQGGEDGLDLYRRLLAQLPGIVTPGAVALFEAAPVTIDALASITSDMLPNTYLEIGEDYAGCDRYLTLTLA